MATRFPNEGDQPSAVLLAWPHHDSDWQPWLGAIEECYSDFVAQLSQHARVILLCRDTPHERHIWQLLKQNNIVDSHIQLLQIMYDDTWVRDYGPISILRNNAPQLLNFQFNAWGGKYQANSDNAVNSCLEQQHLFKKPLQTINTIMEGGSIDTDGQGTMLTTSHCLITDTRNRNMQKADWELMFAEQLGIRRTLWLDHGSLIGDDTDSHVDMLARFCNPETIAYTSCDDNNDIHYQPLQEMKQELESFRRRENKPYRLIPLPLPQAIMDQGKRLPASYANFLILNDAVFVPTYNDPNDTLVQSRLAECFPERQIVPVHARPLIQQYGSLHCATMQIPLAALTETGDW